MISNSTTTTKGTTLLMATGIKARVTRATTTTTQGTTTMEGTVAATAVETADTVVETEGMAAVVMAATDVYHIRFQTLYRKHNKK